jgi:dienelactone hydrolase
VPGVRREPGAGHLDRVRHVALFHSVYGLRPSVLAAAEFFRAAGHTVTTPDLYAGPVASTIDEGFALSERIGWPTIIRRAREAVRDLPADTVLAGLSMGAGVAGELIGERTAGLLLLHGTGADARAVRRGLPVQIHVGEAETMFPPAAVAAWRTAMAAAGAAVELFTYRGARHFFTDAGADEYDEAAATLTWQRSLRFVGSL